MEKDEKTIVDPIEDTVVPTEDETLAQTDEVIPAVTDAPVEAPIEVSTEVPGEVPVADAPLADIVPPVADIPVEPEPVVEEPVVDPVVPTEETGCENCTDLNGCGCESIITIGQYFGTLQESVTIAWRFHLKTRRHHIHITLNEFYDGALKIVDKIIEAYQGICGIVEEPYVNCVVGDGKTEGEYLTELKAFVENNKCVASCGHSEIDSVIDEFLELIDSTNYQLTSFCEHAVKSFEEFCYEDLNESCGCEKGIKDPDLEYGESCGESCGEEEDEEEE